MKVFWLCLFFSPLFSFSKEITSDKAVFRVAEEIIFLSDMVDFGNSLEKMRCLKTDGVILSLFELDIKSLKNLPDFKKINIEKNKDFIQKMILFKKAGHFIETQNVSLDPLLREKIEKNPCIGMNFGKWSNDLRRFFYLEVYFQKRFISVKGKDHKENLESTLNSAKIFLNSLAQKIPHYVFY